MMLLKFIVSIVILIVFLHKLRKSEAEIKKANTKNKESDKSDVRNDASARRSYDELLYSPVFFIERQRKYAYVDGVCHFLDYDDKKDVYSIVINGRKKTINKNQIQSAFNVDQFIIGYKGVKLVCYYGTLYAIEYTYEANRDAAYAFEGIIDYRIAYARGDWYFCKNVSDLYMRDVTSIEEVRVPVNDLPFNTARSALLLSGRNNWSSDVYQFLLILAGNKNT